MAAPNLPPPVDDLSRAARRGEQRKRLLAAGVDPSMIDDLFAMQAVRQLEVPPLRPPEPLAANAGQEELLTYADAAKLLGMKVGTLRNWVWKKRIPHIRLGKQLVRFRRADLESWIAARRVEAK